MEKIKDTKLGKWLKSKAPNVLNTVGDLLPDQGALGLVKNLIDKDPEVDTAEGTAMVDAEIEFQKNVTERWKADMGSDVKLAKLIRPVTLICLMAMFMVTMFLDSLDRDGAKDCCRQVRKPSGSRLQRYPVHENCIR